MFAFGCAGPGLRAGFCSAAGSGGHSLAAVFGLLTVSQAEALGRQELWPVGKGTAQRSGHIQGLLGPETKPVSPAQAVGSLPPSRQGSPWTTVVNDLAC